MRLSAPYYVRQLVWMLKSAVQLMYLMSTGLVWVRQMLSLYIFASFVWVFFVPHWLWYFTSPNVIRRVSYRSSRTTRRRNLMRVLEAEGVHDIPALLKREQQRIRASRGLPLKARRRRPPPRPASSTQLARAAALSLAAAATASGAAPAATTPTAAAAAENAVGETEGAATAAGAELQPTPPLRPARRPPPPRRPPLTANAGSGSDAASAATTARAGSDASPSPVPIEPLERLLRESDRFSNVNPADGTVLRSLPRQQPQPPHPRGSSAAAAAAGGGGCGSSSSNPDAAAAAVAAAEQQLMEAFPDRSGSGGPGAVLAMGADGDAQPPPPPPPPPLRVRRRPPPPLRCSPASTAPPSGASDWADIEEDEEDRLNLHNRASVDIVLPVPLDSLMKSMDYAKRSARIRRKKFPIVIDVSGGVWIIGSHLWSSMLARVLALRGYVVFCPDYRNFPQTTMEGMTLDVSDAIAWVLNNAERYNGDLDDVTLVGQSAGAHLTMMSLLSQAHICAYEEARRGSADGNVSLPPPSPVAYNVPRYNPRKSIRRYVGLSGLYNLERLAPHLHRRGLNTPVLEKIAGGRDQLPRYSLHAYFDGRGGGETGETLPDSLFDFLPQRMCFLHGDCDPTAPVTESASLVGVLRAAQEEFTQRRRARIEERRRHTHRSRGLLLPPALASTSPSGGGSSLERDGGEEQGGPQRRRQQQRIGPFIVPAPAEEQPLPPVAFEFVLIPDARHTDAVIEECVVGHRSCCADFICDYMPDGTTAAAAAAAARSPLGVGVVRGSPVLQVNLAACGLPPTAAAFQAAGGEAGVAMPGLGSAVRKWGQAVDKCVPPDGVLPMAVPPEDRPRVLNWVTYFCPF